MEKESRELEDVQRKLKISQEKMMVVIGKLTRLQELLAPLSKEIAAAQIEQAYLQKRIEKLTKMLEG